MKAKLSEIFEINYKMSALSRYSQTHLIKGESVLEHTGFVCLMSYYLSIGLKSEGKNMDIGKLMSKAVSHDIDEIITGDIPRPTKYYNEGVRDALQTIEDHNMKFISRELETGHIYDDWKKSKDGKEGLIVSICDSLAVVYKVWYEVKMFGNMTITDHADGLEESLYDKFSKIQDMIGYSEFLFSIIKDAIILCKQIKTGEIK